MGNKIAISRLRELLAYNEFTGVFTRKIPAGRHGRHKAGAVCGSVTVCGYVFICVAGVKQMAHRFAWAHYYGVWPNGDLDHIDRNKSNNAIANLREATRKQNMQNVSIHKHNTSGYKGVAWHSQRGKWRAYIFNNYTQLHLGLYGTKEDAARARKNAELKYHSHRTA
jgi:hypothetical protein